MSTHHRWFRSGSYSLLAHLDLPETQNALSGAVIVPPFGWEDVCSYRPLRALASSLAQNGIPTLRFDLPGTGDSSGSALDSNLVASWIQSVEDAVSELTAATGITRISVIGVRLGAMLALAASRVKGDLVLWAASATGRALLRELRAFRNMEATEHAADEVLPPPPVAGLEIAGFLLNPETQSALEALDTSNLPPMPGRRVLLLSRDDFPHDAKLVRSLEQAGCALTARTGVGYTAMMGLPHEAVPPVESGEIIVEFLQAGIADNQNDLPSAKEAIPASSFEHGVIETICLLTTAAGTIFSILTEPPAGSLRSDWCLLFLNSGGVRHIGSNRMWVEAARRWATLGIPSLRMDFHKVGESDGDPNLSVESLYQDDLVQQLGSAIANLRMRLDSHRFLAIGLCSGAYAAFQGALHNPAIRGAILLNPRLFFWDPAVDQRRLNRRVVTGLGDASDWLRLARGEIQPDRLKEAARVVFQKLLRNGHSNNREPQIPREAMARAWSTVERFGTRLTLVFAAGEPLLQEMEEEGQLPPATNPLIRCVRVQKVGHTFRSLWAQKQAQEIIDREIDLILHTDRPSDRPNFHLAQPFSSNFAGT